jgi:glycosyltransferase involved in cell wall biosynthesis
MQPKLRVLVLLNYYLPGYRAGGPIRTVANLVQALGRDFQFRVVTADRDQGESQPYDGITANQWNRVGNAEVFYLPEGARSLVTLTNLLREAEYDVLYVNSFFSPRFSIFPLLLQRVGLAPSLPVILAPRGEFAQAALTLKSIKKRAYLRASMALGICSAVRWHASTEFEAADIRRAISANASCASVVNVFIARDIAAHPKADPAVPRKASPSPALRIIFVSRVSRMKNLDFALRVLQAVRCKVKFDIYGPKEDPQYWAECEDLARQVPPNVEVTYHGALEHNMVRLAMSNADLFFVPSLGENFGHVFAEAFSSGVPVLVSDRTPWRNLERLGIGWDVPLHDVAPFAQTIETVAKMDPIARANMRERCISYSEQQTIDDDSVTLNRELFRGAVQAGPKP